LENHLALRDTPLVTLTVDFELVGREEEVSRLHRFVDDVGEGPRAFAIRGDAGIGKTVLWRAGVEAAEEVGVRVLAARCVEAEMPLAFGGLADLLETAFAEVAEEVPAPQRELLAVAVGREAPHESSPDEIALPRVFVATLRALAARTPVLLAVDDLQWLDVPSRKILAFAVRRLGDVPVGLLVTQRGDRGDPLDLQHAFDEQSREELALGPLSIGALHQLVRSRLGVRIPRPTLARVHAASGGNPMFALEFARVVAGSHTPGPLPVPSSLEELVRERVAGFPETVAPLLTVVAAVERPTPQLLANAIDGSESLLDDAIDAGSLVLGDDGFVRFTHPLLASAIYTGLPPGRRRALHARLAAVGEDLEERARHLALSAAEPDVKVAHLLDRAASKARARGAPDTAVELAQQAVRLTPESDVEAREERVVVVAGYLADAGHVAGAVALLDELLAGDAYGPRRASALLTRIQVEDDRDARARWIRQALEHAGEEAAIRAQALLLSSLDHAERGNVEASELLAREALAEAEKVDDPALFATALVRVAYWAEYAGRPEPDLLDRAIAISDAHGVLPRTVPPRMALAELRLGRGDLGAARELLEAAPPAIRSGSRELDRARLLFDLILLELSAGNWDVAESYFDEAWQLAFDGGDGVGEAMLAVCRAALAMLRGRVDDARRLGGEAIARAEAAHWPMLVAKTREALGLMELSRGEPGEAWQWLADAPGRIDLAEARRVGPLPDAVEALVGLGRLDEAEAIVAGLEAQLQPGDCWAAPAAERCRALLLLARGDAKQASTAADASAAGFEAAGFRFERGRSLLVAGEALRRLGERRRAAEKLEAAKAIFSELGAALWLERADRELRRASPRPRRDRDLTSAERRVAALVAKGRTNREVSAQLFTTVGTVEVHLTRIYRKLGIRSRTELARRVAEGTLDLTEA
jgi:DNA-binding NarL/FixJ family response regulator